MMQMRQLTENVAVAGQIQPEDVPGLAEQGFRSLVCNRPDAEEPTQPRYAEIEAAAKAAGLEIRFIPVTHAGIMPDQVSAFRAALDEMPLPMLAFCRSGARSGNLFAAAEASA